MINTILERTSCRSYSKKKIEIAKINKLKQIVNASPSAINAQPVSTIFVTNEKIKQHLLKFNFDQSHVLQAPLIVIFCADWNRISHDEKLDFGYAKYLSATIDATIACTSLMYGAQALGLSTCLLGGFRRFPNEVNNILKISGKCVPTLGICVGYSAKIGAKIPKINKCYDQYYNINKLLKETGIYDKTMSKFYKKIIGKEIKWSEMVNKSIEKISLNKSVDEIKEIFECK